MAQQNPAGATALAVFFSSDPFPRMIVITMLYVLVETAHFDGLNPFLFQHFGVAHQQFDG